MANTSAKIHAYIRIEGQTPAENKAYRAAYKATHKEIQAAYQAAYQATPEARVKQASYKLLIMRLQKAE